MTKKLNKFGLLFFTLLGPFAFAQTDKEIALEKGKQAIKLMDNGKFDESIKLLEVAQKLDPDMFDYPYELAYAYYAKEDYKEAIKILEKNINHKGVTDRLFQLLGNAYDVLGKSDKAIEVYDLGLSKFPDSGEIYLEKGNIFWSKKEYSNALPFYEKGIEVDPKFPSNYYRATRIYCGSTEEVWGMIYGEIFINLERNSKRTSEISKLLFETYKSEIKFSSDTSYSVSFSKNANISIIQLNDPKSIKLPFGIGCYEMILMMSVLGDKQIDINSLDRIRSRFVETYFKGDNSKNYPNILFDYQQKVKNEGHFEAYNHWILMKGDELGFNNWQTNNSDKWNKFIEWFTVNGLDLNDKSKFYSGQY